jgi:hypothetical protein
MAVDPISLVSNFFSYKGTEPEKPFQSQPSYCCSDARKFPLNLNRSEVTLALALPL